MTFTAEKPTGTKADIYHSLEKQAAALLGEETDAIANAANFSALLFHAVPDVNWLGFYFHQSAAGQLVLGPFQGQVACTRIPVGQGVCGTAFATETTQRVADVNAFPGHIACDSTSRSELVVPLLFKGRCFGVLDVDSPLPARFDAVDQAGMERLAQVYVEALSAPPVILP